MPNRLTRSNRLDRSFTRSFIRRLATLPALPALLGALLLVACGATTGAGGGTSTSDGTPTSAPAYDAAAGHILIRLYHTPGNRFPPLSGVPDWTLFGDGTLIYRDPAAVQQPAANPSGLLVAHLSADQVNHLLELYARCLKTVSGKESGR